MMDKIKISDTSYQNQFNGFAVRQEEEKQSIRQVIFQ
jgi:hypothetical protein